MEKFTFLKYFIRISLVLTMTANAQAVSESDQEEKVQDQGLEIPSLVGLPSESLDALRIIGLLKWESDLSENPGYRSPGRLLGLIAPYLSAQKLVELDEIFPMIRERAPEALSESESEVSFSNQVISHLDCLKYFDVGGLFEHAKKLKFTEVEIDPKCISEFPKTITELSLIKTKTTRPQVLDLTPLCRFESILCFFGSRVS